METTILIIFVFLATCYIFLSFYLMKVEKKLKEAKAELVNVTTTASYLQLEYQKLHEAHIKLCFDFGVIVRSYGDWCQAQAELEIEKSRIYELVLRFSKEGGAKIERAQLMTGVESPHMLAADALMFYLYMIDRKSEGWGLFIGANRTQAIPLRFEPLDRVRPKTDN